MLLVMEKKSQSNSEIEVAKHLSDTSLKNLKPNQSQLNLMMKIQILAKENQMLKL
ncbi:7232_t:CDS:2 [Funneliformis mosseae]|uniref:7232_t:CDS:1 n=1 Tax=Funneliformis mosseae TaxID=27381 RepID=A0A9N9FIA9_FUNMO|nr:7232_t:CDS:2 [Funneliformis mosseae]